MLDAKTNCSFCSKHKNDVDKLIVGETASICNECVELCQGLLQPKTTQVDRSNTRLDPQAIKSYLDKHVVGQDEAKIVLSVAVANHMKRLSAAPDFIKPNILMVGPSGSGKTLLVKTIAGYLDLPIAISDATGLTEAGYAGEDVESVLSRLLASAKGDVELAQQGIVFIDEIDKIARRNDAVGYTRDVSGEGVQQALLKMIEGTMVRVPMLNQKKSTASELVEIDTSKILFVGGGAFVDIEKIIRKRQTVSSIGFNSSTASTVDLSSIQVDDLIAYGLIPEFVGRFANVVTLRELTADELESILCHVENNIIAQYNYLCSCDDIELEFSSEAITRIIERCIQARTGARFLVAELEKVMRPHLFNLHRYSESGIHKIIIDQLLVDSPRSLLGEPER